MNNYFICVQYKYIDNGDTFLASDLIQAESVLEALGKLLVKQNYLNEGASVTLRHYSVIKTDLVEPDKMIGYNWEIAAKSWENLVNTSQMDIMRGVDSFLDMDQKISAIKHLRNFLKPWVGLKVCKRIIEERESERAHGNLIRCPLPTLIKRFRE